MSSVIRRILDYLGYVQTWIWIWGIVSASLTIAVAIWALISRLPSVLVFVLALGIGVLTLVGLETSLVVYRGIKDLLGARYQRAVADLAGLRTSGVVLSNRPVNSDAEAKAFAADYADFEADAIAAMKGTAPLTDISWFQDLHEWTAPQGLVGYNDEHALLKAILDEKLRRMLRIAERLDAKIS